MSAPVQLIMSVPAGTVTATSLGVEGFAWHRSPGSGKYFKGRTVFGELALAGPQGLEPAFQFMDEGGWRDARGDTVSALEKAAQGRRTKTALSNNAFSAVPVGAYQNLYLGKTGGEVLRLEPAGQIAQYSANVPVRDGMTPAEIAQAVGLPALEKRLPRLYLIFAPIEFLILTSLTPEEYVWYTTHRPGKIFRQVMFTELRADQHHLAASAVYNAAREELTLKSTKKTKTIATGDCFASIPYSAWLGYNPGERGGLYVGDATQALLWEFPAKITRSWDRADG